MITGNPYETAKITGRRLGLVKSESQIMLSVNFANLNQTEKIKAVSRITVFARVTPEQKIMIVLAWQAAGNLVAVTGDGLNDAPALKTANLGVAMVSGTEIARDAS